jgi:uncharacterized membrane protein YhaH (DUF805 family)
MEWIIAPLKKYATFSGRARRKEFWMFFLALFVVNAVLGSLSGGDVTSPFYMISGLFGLATLLPFIAVTVRRLHDQDKTGLLALLMLIPLLGSIILLIMCIPAGTAGPNQYGADPKAA